MRTILISLCVFTLALLAACSSDSAKKNISKAGDAAGQAVGEFVSGVSTGVQKAFDMTVELPKSLETKGIKFGKITVQNDAQGTDNLLTVYFIFEKDFDETLLVKVFDRKGLEMGRAKQKVAGTKGDAKFIEFHFDKHTNIDVDSKLTIE